MIELDGSKGEGGGQILRSALAISILTGQPFVIKNIRAGRKKPGLAAQHLASVAAAQQISNASVDGARLASQTLRFTPQKIIPGSYFQDITTAGAASLVLQTVFLPLALADSSSKVRIRGGTHVPWSPCFHYLKLHWLPLLRTLGISAALEMRLAGYYPKGGGEILAEINPASEILPFNSISRGELRKFFAISAVSKLDKSIALRQAQQGERRLKALNYRFRTEIMDLPGAGPGTLYFLGAEFDKGRCCYFGLGARGKRAEKVADEAVDSFLDFMQTRGAVDEHLADQLVLPLAFSRQKSVFSTDRITNHLITNLETFRMFNKLEYEIDGEIGSEGIVTIFPL